MDSESRTTGDERLLVGHYEATERGDGTYLWDDLINLTFNDCGSLYKIQKPIDSTEYPKTEPATRTRTLIDHASL